MTSPNPIPKLIPELQHVFREHTCYSLMGEQYDLQGRIEEVCAEFGFTIKEARAGEGFVELFFNEIPEPTPGSIVNTAEPCCVRIEFP